MFGYNSIVIIENLEVNQSSERKKKKKKRFVSSGVKICRSGNYRKVRCEKICHSSRASEQKEGSSLHWLSG